MSPLVSPRIPRRRSRRSESGKGLVWLAFALPALLGLVGLTLDTGRLYIGRQRAVNVVDLVTLDASLRLRGTATDLEEVRQFVLASLAANNSNADAAWAIQVSDAAMAANRDILVAGFNDTPATNSALAEPAVWLRDDGSPANPNNPPTFAPDAGFGVMVRGHTAVGATFMTLLGFGDTAIGAAATIITDCAGLILGSPHVIPIWISGDFTPGDEVDLALNDGNPPLPPGSYGFLAPRSFAPYTHNNSVFWDWLQFGAAGDVNLEIYAGGSTSAGSPGIVTAHTGWQWGQVKHALGFDPTARGDKSQTGGRIQRASLLYPDEEPETPCGQAPGDDPGNPAISSGNSRIVVVPIVEYAGGVGATARFKVTAFGAFYLRCIGNDVDKGLNAQFINFVTLGSGGGVCTGVRVKEFVR